MRDRQFYIETAALIVATVILIAFCAFRTETVSEPVPPEGATVLTGTGEGFGGDIIAKVTTDGDKIIALTLTGDSESPDIGGTALSDLKEAILANGSIDGVDAISGATLTSNGVFAAIEDALGS